MHYPATHEVMSAIDTFYFNHYCQVFRSGAFARANSSMYVGSRYMRYTNTWRLMTYVHCQR
ncbi:hypothetical protein BGY98DRAFT_993836 [Russula aff. rugulosa BPL654]|nr:hypothetical protein BGY98DRAFT_993836 [Russula aff. rugulosa BPL654]